MLSRLSGIILLAGFFLPFGRASTAELHAACAEHDGDGTSMSSLSALVFPSKETLNLAYTTLTADGRAPQDIYGIVWSAGSAAAFASTIFLKRRDAGTSCSTAPPTRGCARSTPWAGTAPTGWSR